MHSSPGSSANLEKAGRRKEASGFPSQRLNFSTHRADPSRRWRCCPSSAPVSCGTWGRRVERLRKPQALVCDKIGSHPTCWFSYPPGLTFFSLSQDGSCVAKRTLDGQWFGFCTLCFLWKQLSSSDRDVCLVRSLWHTWFCVNNFFGGDPRKLDFRFTNANFSSP